MPDDTVGDCRRITVATIKTVKYAD